MTDKWMDCITNPVKCKLLLEINSQGKTTAKHLADIYTDIPQATLYRNLKKMTSDGILKVVEETQVRGTVERTYALAFDLSQDPDKLLEKNSGTIYMQLFMQYIIGFTKQFQQYCQSPDIDIKNDMTGFSLAPLYLTNEELTSLMEQLSHVIRSASGNKSAPGRKLRNIGIIVSPEEKMDK